MSDLPNLIFILTDNQSDWTLGCYGNREIQTPNIDRLARDGKVLENAFAVNPVCSPNRATFLTGLMPSSHGVHSWLGLEKPDSQMGPDAYCTIGEFETLPALLAGRGYDCGMVGKWHLGNSFAPQLGFDYWYAKPMGHTKSFYDAEAIWNGKVQIEPGYYTDAIANHAIDFLDSHHSGARTDQPFFLYLGFNGPYGLDDDLRTGHRNRWTSYYEDKALTCFPRLPTHPWLKQNLDLLGSETAIRGYAAAISGVDDATGAVLKKLEELGEAENTIVIYTSDQGLCAGHHGFWGMGDHSRPRHMAEENLHIPMIVRHPRRISPGTWAGHTCTYDLYPTLVEYLGLDSGDEETLPGRSFAGFLEATGASGAPWNDTTYHEYENTRAVHTRTHKLIRRFPSGPDELYDLSVDPDETNNLIDAPETDLVRDGLQESLGEFFNRFVDSRYDLWKEGVSKAGGVTS